MSKVSVHLDPVNRLTRALGETENEWSHMKGHPCDVAVRALRDMSRQIHSTRRLNHLHHDGHRSQHWFDDLQKDTDKHVTFCLYHSDKRDIDITGQGSTFIEALQAALDLWDSKM